MSADSRRPCPVASRKHERGLRPLPRSGCSLFRLLFFGAVLPALLLAVPARGEPNVEQTIVLRPGWNSVYLEVEPVPNDVASAFAGLPVSSVWSPIRRPSAVEYIQDPAEGLFNRPGWLGYRPGDPPYLQSLFTLQANRPYLIRLEGGVERTWSLSGRPSLRDVDWVPDSFNLVGLPVDPSSAITFAGYFAASPAHSGQPLYQLAANGVWELLNATTDTIRSGEAYWVFCDGASSYPGPLSVEVELSDGLDFAGVAVERTLQVSSPSGASAVLLRLLPSAQPVPLSYFALDDEGNIDWRELSGDLLISLSSETPVPVRLAVRRADFASEQVEGVLELSDGSGVRRLIPVSATRRESAPLPAGSRARRAAVPADTFAGLWVGLATINSVSEAQTGSVTPMPTASDFGLRLIVHVDASGQARLLKHAIQMWEDGTLNPDGTVAAPGRFVLVTDEQRISLYRGASLRDGDPVGFRVSTAAYAFPGNELTLTGSFDPAGTLGVDLVLEPDSPTHPYKHRFHPDHDNLDAQFLGFVEEAYRITRSIELQFSAVDPLGQDPPEWGDTLVGGVYRETLSGLHRNEIFVEGSFRFRRVADIAELNP